MNTESHSADRTLSDLRQIAAGTSPGSVLTGLVYDGRDSILVSFNDGERSVNNVKVKVSSVLGAAITAVEGIVRNREIAAAS